MVTASLPALATGPINGIDLPPAAVNNPDVPLSVIRALPAVIQQNGTIRIDPNIDPTLPIIYPDGTPVPGQRMAATEVSAGCDTWVYGLPGAWGAVANGTCAVAGSPGLSVYYNWETAPDIDSDACVQGTGWTSSGQTWYDLSCGWESTYTWAVPWGNVLAQPKFKAESISPPLGTTAIVDY